MLVGSWVSIEERYKKVLKILCRHIIGVFNTDLSINLFGISLMSEAVKEASDYDSATNCFRNMFKLCTLYLST